METSADYLLGERIEHLSHAVITKCRLTDTNLLQITGSQIGFGEKQENRISLGKKIVDLSHIFHIAI